MFFVQQVAFLVRILMRKCKKRKKCKKALVFIVKMFTVIVFEDYLFKNLQRERFFKKGYRDRRPAGDVSIVSVYCKCPLWVTIVSVYCKRLLCPLSVSIVSLYCDCLL